MRSEAPPPRRTARALTAGRCTLSWTGKLPIGRAATCASPVTSWSSLPRRRPRSGRLALPEAPQSRRPGDRFLSLVLAWPPSTSVVMAVDSVYCGLCLCRSCRTTNLTMPALSRHARSRHHQHAILPAPSHCPCCVTIIGVLLRHVGLVAPLGGSLRDVPSAPSARDHVRARSVHRCRAVPELPSSRRPGHTGSSPRCNRRAIRCDLLPMETIVACRDARSVVPRRHPRASTAPTDCSRRADIDALSGSHDHACPVILALIFPAPPLLRH